MEDAELRAALETYGLALDRLDIEIAQMPPQPGRTARWLSRLWKRLPAIDWLLGQFAMVWLGRPIMDALDGFAAAANGLLLIAPPSLLDPLEEMGVLLGRFAGRDASWNADWRRARARLLAAARCELALAAPEPSRPDAS